MRRQNPLTYSFGISLLFHAGLVVAISLWMASSHLLDLSPKSYIELSSEKVPEKVEPSPKLEKTAPKAITPPKLIDKGDQARVSNPAQTEPVPEVEDLEKVLSRLPGDLKIDQGTPFAFVAPSPTSEGNPKPGFGPGEIKAFGQPIAGEGASNVKPTQSGRGSEAGAGILSSGGDVAVIPGGGSQGGGGGTAERGLGMGHKGLSTLTPGGGGLTVLQGANSSNGVFSTARPTRIRHVLPTYPRSARLAGIEGISLLKVEVLPDGSVGRILIEASSGNPELDRTASAAVSQWRFAPARQGDRRIKCWVRIPVRFQLRAE